MASPIYYIEDRPISSASNPSLPDEHEDQADRVQRLEEEVNALRDTVSRFSELMLVELKRIAPPEPRPTPNPITVSMQGMAPVPIAIPTPQSQEISRGWVLPELLGDLMTLLRMYFDPRYRLRRTTQLFVPLILVLFFLNHLFWAAIPLPIVNSIGEKIGDIILAVLLFKVLYREMLRYREVLAQYRYVDVNLTSGGRIMHSDDEAAHSRLDIDQ